MIRNSSTNVKMCGLPLWVRVPNNDTVSQLNEVIVVLVNAPICVFAFLSNLLIILAVIRTPTLQKPCIILLCSLASADCLTGAVAQPVFVARRLMLRRIYWSCAHQEELFVLHEVTLRLTWGWSFVSIVVISFDRHHALSRPLIYRVNATKNSKLLIYRERWKKWNFTRSPPSVVYRKLNLTCVANQIASLSKYPGTGLC